MCPRTTPTHTLIEPRSIRDSPRRETVMRIQEAALAAVEPGAAVRRSVERAGQELIVAGRTYDLTQAGRIWLAGGGKAAAAMTAAVCDIVGDRLAGGLVVTKHGHSVAALDTGPVTVVEAGHPVPDEAGVKGTRRMVDLLAGLGESDLVIVVLSGGGSAMLTLPAPGLTLSDLQRTTGLLLRSGATIVELNTVRKHLSQIKGGGLVRQAAPAGVIGLILSDVVGDPLDAIASGPTTPDPTTFVDAWSVLERYGLAGRVPAAVSHWLKAGRSGDAMDSPKPGDPLFDRVQNVIVGSNRLAAEAAVQAAQKEGIHALLLSTFIEGEAREVGRVAAALAKELVYAGQPLPKPACLVWGGETTVVVRGGGRGGRNQELALAAAIAMEGLEKVLLVALGTDGTDGPTDAAGAVATGQTADRARAGGLDPVAYLADNDAYSFFEGLGDLIHTGPTGTNVNDLLFLFAFP